jgi:hypothetical protein
MLYKVTNIIFYNKPYSARIDPKSFVKVLSNNRHLSKLISKYKNTYYIAKNTPSFKQNTYLLPMFSLYATTMLREIDKVKEYDKVSRGFKNFDLETTYSGSIMINHDSYSLEGIPAIILL